MYASYIHIHVWIHMHIYTHMFKWNVNQKIKNKPQTM